MTLSSPSSSSKKKTTQFCDVEIGARLSDFAGSRQLAAGGLVGLKILGMLAYIAVHDHTHTPENHSLCVETGSTAIDIYAIDELGPNHYLVTADKDFENQRGAGELTTRLGTMLLGPDCPNVIIPTSATTGGSPTLYLVDARNGRVTKINAVEPNKWPTFVRALNNKTVLATAGANFYKGVFDGNKGTFTWTKVGDARNPITFLGRVDGDYVVAATNKGEQLIVQGVNEMKGKQQRNNLTVMHTIEDSAVPVGKIAGDDKTFAMFENTVDGIAITFAPWANSDKAPKIVRALHALAAA
jgi:hypothetical protein